MATHSMPPADLLDYLASADVDALQAILRHALQRLIEAEASAYIGAAPGEHTPERRAYRNGQRARPFDTRPGRLELQIPKLRTGGFVPSLLEPR
jgi:putative transposase